MLRAMSQDNLKIKSGCYKVAAGLLFTALNYSGFVSAISEESVLYIDKFMHSLPAFHHSVSVRKCKDWIANNQRFALSGAFFVAASDFQWAN